MNLNNIDLDIEYSSETKNPPIFFYVECLKNSISYDRCAGYFSSAGIAAAASGFAYFLNNDGKIRLICSPKCENEQDIDLLYNFSENKRSDYFKNILDESIFDIKDKIIKERLNVVAWLLYEKKLEIKIALHKKLYHEKRGIFTDTNGNSVSFNGSNNETRGGWIDNYESLKVFKSWDYSKEYVDNDRNHFDKLWNQLSNDKDLFIISLSDAVKNNFIDKFKVTDKRPKTDPIYEQWINKQRKPSLPEIYSDPNKSYFYQDEAINKWVKSNFNGFFQMATGTGKTVTSLKGLLKLIELKDNIFTIITVPKNALLSQWENEVSLFNFKNILTTQHKNWKESLSNWIKLYNLNKLDNPVFIATYASFINTFIQQQIKDNDKLTNKMLLIADEAHTIGAKETKKIISSNKKINHKIGLSATPHRHFDEYGTSFLMNFFNSLDKPTFTMNIDEAIKKGHLCEYLLYPYTTNLTNNEYEKYVEITKKLQKYYIINDQGDIKIKDNYEAEKLLRDRKNILNCAKNKENKLIEIYKKIIKSENSPKYTIVYCPEKLIKHDNIEYRLIDLYGYKLKEELNINLKHFTSINRNNEENNKSLELFKDGEIDCLMAMKCLDEGVDVKRATNAIFLASTTNPKQYIQRRGRVLRKHKKKNYAKIYDIITLPPKNSNIDRFSKSVINGELKRLREFAKDATNWDETNTLISIIENEWEIERDKGNE